MRVLTLYFAHILLVAVGGCHSASCPQPCAEGSECVASVGQCLRSCQDDYACGTDEICVRGYCADGNRRQVGDASADGGDLDREDGAGGDGGDRQDGDGGDPGSPAATFYISSIEVVLGEFLGHTYAEATLAVLDTFDQAVPDARIDAHWEGATENPASGTTRGDGEVTLLSGGVRSPPPGTVFTVVVDTATKDGWTWDEARSVKTASAQAP